MNKRGSALIMGLFVVLVLSILTSTFLYKRVNQNFLSLRYADEIQALWAAEAGIQAVRNNNLLSSVVTGTTGNATYSATSDQIGMSDYYHVVSTGTSGTVSRTVETVISTREVDATKFKYGVESTVTINFKGSSTVYGENTTRPVPSKYRDPEYYHQNSTFSFADLFCFSTDEVKSLSTVYNGSWPSGSISGVNWVVAPSNHFKGNVYGSGILIVEGDLRVTGTIDFDGIIYVMGELDMAGTAIVGGAILAESSATVDTTLTGTCDVEHNTTKIQAALDLIKYRSPRVVSWKEL
ncbi:MAG TPA: hypothetical protein PK562_04170 [Candidatus Omnitrophota bacterium]|nr:hypothetical protein [Candidatus Omnitrophota bacterium]